MVESLPEDVRKHIAESSKLIDYAQGILEDASEAFACPSVDRDQR